MMEWQLIETAPKDGTWIETWTPNEYQPWWQQDIKRWGKLWGLFPAWLDRHGKGDLDATGPTHWRSLAADVTGARLTATEAALAAAVEALRAIRDYPRGSGNKRRTEDGYPLEIIYDEWAYRRIVDSYRSGAGAALARIEEAGNGDRKTAL